MSEVPFDARSPGEMLRTAREKQGLHIAALAAAIKVSPRKLDALEHDRWDELPDATFVRALAQTVCRTLKLDPAPVLALMPPPGGVTFEPTAGGLNAPFRDRPGRDEPGLSLGAIRPMVLAASVLMLAAVALVFVPDRYWSGAAFRSAATPASAPALAVAPAASVASAAVAASAPAPAVEASASGAAAAGLFPPPDAVPVLAAVPPAATGLGVPAAAASAQVTPPAGAAAPAAPAAPVAAAVAAVSAAPNVPVTAERSASGAAAGSGVLQVRTTGVSWIEARDGGGRVLLSRVLQAGERLGLDGSAPIRVTIGNAAVTRLDFRGQPVDLAPSTRDNVVRIELK